MGIGEKIGPGWAITQDRRGKQWSFIKKLESIFTDPKGILSRNFNRLSINHALLAAVDRGDNPAIQNINNGIASALLWNGLSQLKPKEFDNFNHKEGRVYMYSNRSSPNNSYFRNIPAIDQLTGVEQSQVPVAYIVNEQGQLAEVFFTGISDKPEEYIAHAYSIWNNIVEPSQDLLLTVFTPTGSAIEKAAKEAELKILNSRQDQMVYRTIKLPVSVDKISEAIIRDEVIQNVLSLLQNSFQPVLSKYQEDIESKILDNFFVSPDDKSNTNRMNIAMKEMNRILSLLLKNSKNFKVTTLPPREDKPIRVSFQTNMKESLQVEVLRFEIPGDFDSRDNPYLKLTALQFSKNSDDHQEEIFEDGFNFFRSSEDTILGNGKLYKSFSYETVKKPDIGKNDFVCLGHLLMQLHRILL